MTYLKKILQKPKALFLIFLTLSIFITFFTYKLRFLGFERIPQGGVILDEFMYGWQGISLRTSGIPVSWSNLSPYFKGNNGIGIGADDMGFSLAVDGIKPNLINYDKYPKPVVATEKIDYGLGILDLTLVQPYLDHPPISGLILSLGIPDHLSTFKDIKIENIRLVSLFLGVINSVLIFILLFLITKNHIVSLLGSIIYCTVPTFVFASRFALAENVLATFSLISFIFLNLSSIKKIRLASLVAASVFTGFAILSKESGLGFFIGFLILLFLWQYPKKYIALFTGIILLMGLFYVFWGVLISGNLFWQILLSNSTREFFGSLNFLYMLPALRFKDFPIDGWWIWGWISLLIIYIEDKDKAKYFLMPVVAHLITILLFGGLNYPWYYLGLIPYLAASTGWSLFILYKKINLAFITAFILIPFSSSLYFGNTVFNLPPNTNIYKLLILGLISISILRILKPSNFVKYFWAFFCFMLIILVTKWNSQSILYMIENWGKLALPSYFSF